MQQRRRRMPSVKKIKNTEKWIANDISIYQNWNNLECFFKDFDVIKEKRKKGRLFQCSSMVMFLEKVKYVKSQSRLLARREQKSQRLNT